MTCMCICVCMHRIGIGLTQTAMFRQICSQHIGLGDFRSLHFNQNAFDQISHIWFECDYGKELLQYKELFP